MEPLHLAYDQKEARYDADGRSDSQPVYIGFAVAETPTNLAAWTIWKFTFSGSFATRRQIVYKKKWDDRSSVFP